MLTVKQVLDSKDKILTEAAQSQVGCCMTHSFDYLVEAGILQVLSPDAWTKELRAFCDYVETNLETFTDLFTEGDMEKAFEDAELGECPDCGWWCDDLWHESVDFEGESVCNECENEGEEDE